MDNASIRVIGKPSAALADKLEKETKERTTATQKKYGEEGLKKLQTDLEAAQKANDHEIPEDVLRKFKIPDVSSIRWIEVHSARPKSQTKSKTNAFVEQDNDVQAHIDADHADLPLFLQFDRMSLPASIGSLSVI